MKWVNQRAETLHKILGKLNVLYLKNNMKVKENTNQRLCLSIRSLLEKNTSLTSSTLMETVKVSLSKKNGTTFSKHPRIKICEIQEQNILTIQ